MFVNTVRSCRYGLVVAVNVNCLIGRALFRAANS
jgi:hypothetical protein